MRPRREGEDGGPSRKESRLRKMPKGRSGDPNRFSGNGIQFKAKIIGTERVLDARGNRMCQGALQRLKAAVKTSGDHKQRITLNVSLNGIIIKDEKSGEVLHHHPIHKISFISQDTGDNRAFGYVYGCPQTGHDFFGIKTEKMASQVVLALRDLFLAALELKKKEMEEEVEVPAAEVSFECGTSNEQSIPNHCQRMERILSKELPNSDKPPDEPNGAAAENVLLKYSVDSLKQGISHMDRSIARGFGFSFSEDDVSESSVNSIPASFQFKMDKLTSLYQETLSLSSRSSSTSEYACASTEFQEEDKQNASASSEPTSENASSSEHREDRYAVFLEDIDALPSVFDNPDITLQPIVTARPKTPVKEDHKEASDTQTSAPIAFAELDPLGSQPYVDRKDFFHELKKPPKKALKDLTDSAELFSPRLNADLFQNPENGITKSTVASPAFNVPPPPFNPFADPPVLPTKRPPFPDPAEEVPWGHRSPFNPFVSDECLDVPPPSSPPPPPPPRLPSKNAAPCFPPPPPRPPGRPSVPLPAWLSFSQEEDEPPAPPIPSPARKFSQTDTPPCSPAWNSPAVAFSHSEVDMEVFFPEILGDSPRFERKVPPPPLHESRDRNGGTHLSSGNTERGFSRNTGGDLPKPLEGASPPLPPKPGRNDASFSSCVSSSSNGTHSSSSFVFSSSDESRRAGSGGEPFVSSGEHALSPDSIFRRKSDPFADDFFLTLPKKSSFRDFKPSV